MRILLLSVLVSLATPALAQEGGSIDLDLAPGDTNADGIIDQLTVRIALTEPSDEFRLKTLANNVVTSAPDMTEPVFTQGGAVLVPTVRDEEQDPSNTVRFWHVDAAGEALTISYTLSIDPNRDELALPQYELRTGPSGFSGAGLAFLLLPDDERERGTNIRWDLSALAEGAIGASSLGVGDAQSRQPMRSADLGSSYFMAGEPDLFRDAGFFAVWQGDFAFEGRELMDWAARLHHFYGGFFDQVPDSFGVFGRTNTINPGSGIGLTDSFAFTFDETITRDDLKGLLAHEMLHAWVRSLDGTTDMESGLALSWFGEGLAVHYQRLLPWRAGLIDDAAFLNDLNDTAARYYTNALIATPNAEIPSGFWRDTRIRVLPYDRGSLYFAKLDADIRAVSGGARSLDDLVRAMLVERRAGRPMDGALWEKLLRAELGEEGIAGFNAMLGGAVVVPPPDAFGPCFTRIQTPLRRFDLGFDPSVLVSPQRVVRGLKPSSNAAQAGLRNGDLILNRFPQDSMQADQNATLTLRIEREGEVRELTYLPRGESVPAYQWTAQDCVESGPHTERE